jgi:predicted transcriptional regulator
MRASAPPTSPPRAPPQAWRRVAAIATAALVSVATALYQRLTREEIDGHPTRRLLLRIVATAPGTTAQAVAQQEGIPLTTLLHHVRVLVKSGHLATSRVGPAQLLFPRATPPQERERACALHARLARKLYEDARLAPVSVVEATRRHGAKRSSVMEQLDKLAQAGLVTIDRTAPRVTYRSRGEGAATDALMAPAALHDA